MPANGFGKKALDLALYECAEIASALRPGEQMHESVHAARKAIRRLRALLRLVDAEELATGKADQVLRRLGKGLSRLRDAHVVLQTARDMAARHDGVPWDSAITHLKARRDEILDRELAKDPIFERRQALVAKVASDLRCLDWSVLNPAELARALEKSERRASKAQKKARRSRNPEDHHDWRRKVRRLRMQLDVLGHLGVPPHSSTKSKPFGGRVKSLHKLSDKLGKAQDLGLLTNVMKRLPGVEGRKALLAALDEARSGVTP